MSKYWAEIEKTIKKNIELYEAGTPPEIINFLDIDMEVELDWSEQVAYDRYLKRMWDYDNMLRGEREYARASALPVFFISNICKYFTFSWQFLKN